MQQGRDDLDNLIVNSFEDINVDMVYGDSYNRKLISKLHGEENRNGKFRIAALSLITAGLLMMFMYTSEVQYNMTNIQCKIKMDVSILKHNLNLDKYFLGE